MILSVDIETRSGTDLGKCGVYRYVEDPDFEVLLIAWAVDDAPVELVDLTASPIPPALREMLTDPAVTKHAYNANFERTCLAKLLDTPMPPEQWRCTMIHAATLGLPRSLADVGTALHLAEDKQKLKEGADLIRYFCVPCRPTKSNGGRTWNRPHHAREKWETFKAYCIRDVETERTIRHRLEGLPVRLQEQEGWELDQRINDRGIRVDRDMVVQAIQLSEDYTRDIMAELTAITGLDNPKSVAQLKGWLGVEGSLDKKAVKDMRQSGGLDADTDRALAIRQELGKTSVTKYQAMERSVCADGRVRGLFAYYGAARTGRYAGRIVQLQNLPQNHLPDLELARELTKAGDEDGLHLLFGSVPNTLSELIRTALIPDPGKTFVVADFSAIEARIVAWLADEQWRLDVFAAGQDIYCASASRMFGLPVEKHGVNGHLRQKGKIAELALGYGGSVGALKAMGAVEMGLKEDELKPLVDAWREANPGITALWWRLDAVAREVIRGRYANWYTDLLHGLAMRRTNKLFHIRLPSGRELRYWAPKIEMDDQGRENITYGGMDAGRWGKVSTYGPKLVENVVQAIARDCLQRAMEIIWQRYPNIVMHVHDEMVLEVDQDKADQVLQDVLEIMRQNIPWSDGLALKGDGYQTEFYRKD